MNFDPDQYVDVQERISRFWTEYPDGAIVTDAPHLLAFEQVVIRAAVYKHRDHEKPSATGYAAEERGKDYKAGANFTSWHENAETSAIGRALANMGYAVTREDRPSRQEMAKVNANSAAAAEPKPELVRSPPMYGGPKASQQEIGKLHGEAAARGLDHDDLHALAGLKGFTSVKEMTGDQVKTMTAWIMAVKPAELDSWLLRAGRPTMDQRAAAATAK